MNAPFEMRPAVVDNTEHVLKFLKFIERDASHSQDMAQLGAFTGLAKALSEFITNPLNGMVNTFKSANNNLITVVTTIVDQFLSANKENIVKVYKPIKSDSLKYYVVLKEDNTDNRELFFEFIDNYEGLGIDRQIPITFSFLPIEAIGTIDGELTIN